LGHLRAINELTVMSMERDNRCDALIDVLRHLRYRVAVAVPFVLPSGHGRSCRIAYLGSRAWPENDLQCAVSSDLLALNESALDWAGPAVDRVPDFLTWPCSTRELEIRLERSGFDTRPDLLTADRVAVCDQAAKLGLIGQSESFVDMLVLLKRFARSDAAVLIHGETGTGKERAARALHTLSDRAGGPFTAINCGALPDSLMESELFGHERGAFTDAKNARAGLVEQAVGGTLFLDEIESLSPKGQVALLRFLESFEYRRIGGKRTLRIDLRVVSASNVDLNALARRGEFRRDLLYRLNILAVTLPPLRNRPGDLELLAEHFIARYAAHYGEVPLAITPACRRWLEGRDWPGNVRELENTVHRAIVTASDGRLVFGPEESEDGAADQMSFGTAKQVAIERFERRYLTALMGETGGNVTHAAACAGKERRSLGKLLRKHQISPKSYCNRSKPS
jgi:DNA-binding NtrC family response regulator